MTEPFHTWLKTFLEILVLRLLFWCFKRVILMGQSEASHNLLQRKEINLWDWYQTTFSPSLNLNLPSWILAVTQNLFMISLERDVLIQIFLFTPYLIHMIEKKLYSSWWMFNNLRKLTKILWLDEKKLNAAGFISFHSELFKTLQYKTLPWDKFVRKKEHFVKYFVACEIF